MRLHSQPPTTVNQSVRQATFRIIKLNFSNYSQFFKLLLNFIREQIKCNICKSYLESAQINMSPSASPFSTPPPPLNQSESRNAPASQRNDD